MMGLVDFLNMYRTELSASFFAVMTLYGLWRSMLPEAPIDKRVKSILERKTKLVAEQMSAKRKEKRLQPGMNFVKSTVEKMK